MKFPSNFFEKIRAWKGLRPGAVDPEGLMGKETSALTSSTRYYLVAALAITGLTIVNNYEKDLFLDTFNAVSNEEFLRGLEKQEQDTLATLIEKIKQKYQIEVIDKRTADQITSQHYDQRFAQRKATLDAIKVLSGLWELLEGYHPDVVAEAKINTIHLVDKEDDKNDVEAAKVTITSNILTMDIESERLDIKKRFDVHLFINAVYPRVIEKLYGFNVITDDLEGIFPDKGTLPSYESVMSGFENLIRNLEMFPPGLIWNCGLQKVFFVNEYSSGDGMKYGGANYGKEGEIILDIGEDGNIWWAFSHEHFHQYDYKDGEYVKNDQGWITLNPGEENYYHFVSGERAIRSGILENNNMNISGAANDYGKASGPDEDQASVADALLNTETIKPLLERCVYDLVLRRKVEVITGCHFNPFTKRFDRMLTLQEYKALGYDYYVYYSLWSQTEDKTIKMHHKYWNSILDGHPKTYRVRLARKKQ